jgi:hypothetical protein
VGTRGCKYSLEILMMSGMPLETCWVFNKFWNNKFYYKVVSCWLLLLIHTTMHGSMNITCGLISTEMTLETSGRLFCTQLWTLKFQRSGAFVSQYATSCSLKEVYSKEWVN